MATTNDNNQNTAPEQSDNKSDSTKEVSMFADVTNAINAVADYDPRGIGIFVEDNKLTLRLLEVPTPAWFPDSFIRSMKHNLYLKMVNEGAYRGVKSIDEANEEHKRLDFYNEPSGNMLENMFTGAVKNIVSVAANQVMSVTNKVDSMVNGISSMFSKNGAETQSLFSKMSASAREPFLASQPYLKLNGIHLAPALRDKWNVLYGATKATTEAFKNVTDLMSNEGKDAFEKYNKALMKTLRDQKIMPPDIKASTVSEAIQTTLTKPEWRLHGFSELQLLNGISGMYTMTCKLPYFGNEQPFLHSSGEHAFKTGWGANGESKQNNSMFMLFNRLTGMEPVWNKAVDWQPGLLGTEFCPVHYSFNIYNDTLEHVLINLAFLWSFSATTQAVTDMMMLQPPYLYDVEIPGGMRYKYCMCGFSAKACGKLRKLSSVVYDTEGGSSDKIAELFNKVFGLSINPSAFEYVPDYYQVSFSFKSLLPNTWNFIDSYLHDAKSIPHTGDRLEYMLSQAVTNFSNNIERPSQTSEEFKNGG